GFRVWTETFDRELDGAFALQDEIARSIVDALKNKFAVRLSDHEQPRNRVQDRYLQGLFTNVTHPRGVGSIGISVPVQNTSNPFPDPDYTSREGFDPRPADAPVNAAPQATEVTASERYRAPDAGLRTNKITAERTVAPPGTGSATSVRYRAPDAGLRTNKITADVTAAPPETAVVTSVRDRASEAALRTNKVTADGPASIQGFVKYAEGEPIKGADVRIESRDGKQVFSTVKSG